MLVRCSGVGEAILTVLHLNWIEQRSQCVDFAGNQGSHFRGRDIWTQNGEKGILADWDWSIGIDSYFLKYLLVCVHTHVIYVCVMCMYILCIHVGIYFLATP